VTSKDHAKKVAGKAADKQSDSPFRCDNCGATFVSESERRQYAKSEHPKEKAKHAG